MAGTRLLYPKFLSLDQNGYPNAGGKVYVYEAGSTTPAVTYADYDLTAPNNFPVVLNASGVANIFLSYDFRYKIVVTDPDDAVLETQDNLDPSVNTNGLQTTANEAAGDPWIETTTPPSYATSTSFVIPGDYTDKMQVGSRVKYQLVNVTNTGTVITSTFTSPNTTVVLDIDAGGSLDATLARTFYNKNVPNLATVDAGAVKYSLNQDYSITGTVGYQLKSTGTTVSALNSFYGRVITKGAVSLSGATRASAIAQTVDVYTIGSTINFGTRNIFFTMQGSITSAIDGSYQAKPYEFIFVLRPLLTGSTTGIVYYGTVTDKFQVNYTGTSIVRSFSLHGLITPASTQDWTMGLSVDISSFNGANTGNVNGGVAFATATALRAQSITANYSIYQI